MTNNAVKRMRRKLKRLRPRKKRPKTFKTEEAAKNYAEKHGIKKYKIENIRLLETRKPKYRIILE
ncbi:hypothetical protein DRJ22_03935 [Candidatus Woesearchaeota archaeon]|nr:MAG: hypothetical protein DRJ22_03935 [Candidatus Woesearchaeota archaeon]